MPTFKSKMPPMKITAAGIQRIAGTALSKVVATFPVWAASSRTCEAVINGVSRTSSRGPTAAADKLQILDDPLDRARSHLEAGLSDS